METYTPSVHGQGVVIQSVPIEDTGYISRRFVKASGAVGKGQGRIIGGKTEKNLRYYQVLLPSKKGVSMKENHFNPGLYGDCPEVEKPIDKMTFDDAVAIVLGQARQSDFHDEVVEQACQMIEDHHKSLSREAYIKNCF